MNKIERQLGQELLRAMLGLENHKPIPDILASLESLEDTNLAFQETKDFSAIIRQNEDETGTGKANFYENHSL